MPIGRMQDKEMRAAHQSPNASRSGLVRVMPEEEILRIASTLPFRSSCFLNWSGLEVHRYRLHRCKTPEHTYPQLAIFIPHLSKPAKGEVYVAGQRMTGILESGRISIAPPDLPITRCTQAPEHEITVIFLAPFVLAKVAAEAGVDRVEIVPQYSVCDPLINQIGAELDRELTSRTPSPRVYAESLGVALSAHILCRYGKAARSRRVSAGSAQIRRSIEFMNDNFRHDLTLAQVASIANMSKYHFAKSFRRAMGIAPHRYLTDLRIAKARELLATSSLPIQEIAYQVGYADVSHFTAQFLRRVGTTPSGHRRQILPSN